MTFDELFAEHNLTDPEREALVWHLAGMRSRSTVSSLLPHSGANRQGDEWWHRLTKTLADIDLRMSHIEDSMTGKAVIIEPPKRVA